MIIKWMKRLNDGLLGLVVGILIYGVLVELIGVWFVQDKVRYTTGLIIGIACAVFMAINLAMIIEESLRVGEGSVRRLSLKSVLRYLVVCAAFFIMVIFDLGNLFTAFIGALGLKVSAYAQPLLYKITGKSQEQNELEEEDILNN